ncbi:PrsW family glutamic-type intramembrane protease, partial [Thermobifida halotolerans]
MDQQAMLTRDLVLRICATATEFDRGWIELDRKVVAPFTASRDTSLIERITAAAAAVGVEHLLICRTRSEHAYDPVTQVRAATQSLVGVIRSWGDEPTDFLVCLEDLSAAVLVTADELTVAAGPADYVRALVGADIGRARAEFAETARTTRDPELLDAAVRYGCLEQGGRHARTSRPRRDPAERLLGWAEAVRERTPRIAALSRALRGVWGWAMTVVLVLALLFVPGTSGVLPATLLTVWLLVQLAWLARSRTLSFAALLRLAVLGALTTWPVLLVEVSVAAAVGLDPADPLAYAYLAVPVEEIAKFTPLLLFWLVARHRLRRFAAVDYLLAAAACGAGFQLAETLARTLLFGGLPDPLLPQGGLLTPLPGWVDLPGTGIRFSGHAVTTGLVGAALGLAVVGRGLYGARLWLGAPP